MFQIPKKLWLVLSLVVFLVTPVWAQMAGTISGNVRDDLTGQPLIAHVAAFARDLSMVGGAMTDSAGHYLIHRLPPGEYYVFACKMGYECEFFNDVKDPHQATSVTVLAGQNTPGINFGLKPSILPVQPGSISGNVSDANTLLPIPGAIVLACNKYLMGFSYKTRTDSSGNYHLPAVVPGVYEMVAWAFGYQRSIYPDTIVVGPGQDVTDINFRLSPLLFGAISGTVTDDTTGLPIPHAKVFAHKINGIAFGEAFTDSSGNYLIEKLPEGFYKVGAIARGYEFGFYPDPVPVTGNTTTENIDIALHRLPPLPAGTISGNVFDDSTSEPLKGALVAAVAPHPDRHMPPFIRFTFSNEDGNYVLEHLPDLPFFVVAWARGYQAEFYNDAHSLAEADTVRPTASGIDFGLTPKSPGPFAVGGNVIQMNTGEPLAGALVSAYDMSGNLAGASITLPDGAYLIEGLFPAAYTLKGFSNLGTGTYSPLNLFMEDTPDITLGLSVSLRGDLNGDGKVTNSDLIGMINYLFKKTGFIPMEIGDVNCDGRMSTGDLIYMINHLFKRGPAPCS